MAPRRSSRKDERSGADTRPLTSVLFDWDGTLLDSFEADWAAYQALFRHFGIPWGLQDLVRHYSPNWHRIYLAAGLPRHLWEEADRVWRRAYGTRQPPLRPGVRRLLAHLGRCYQLALVTSGHRSRVLQQLQTHRLQDTFRVVVCREDTLLAKPHPAPLARALAALRADSAQAVYVGDAPEDIWMARRAGVLAVGVLGPFPVAERLRAAQPDALLEELQALPELLERWSRRPPRGRGTVAVRLRRDARGRGSAG